MEQFFPYYYGSGRNIVSSTSGYNLCLNCNLTQLFYSILFYSILFYSILSYEAGGFPTNPFYIIE